MLIYRLITALILIPVVILGIYKLPGSAFALITAGISCFMLWEWLALIRLQPAASQWFIYAVFLSLLVLLWYCPWLQQLGLWLALLFWLTAIGLLWAYPSRLSYWHGHLWCRIMIGFLLIAPMWLGLNLLFCTAQGSNLLLLLLIVIWAADSGAYFIGILRGNHKLIAKISPGKSWEGLVGGIVSGLLASSIFIVNVQFLRSHWQVFLLLSAFVIFIALLGDLTESLFKRLQGVKDSGRLLPGHGGILDRLDSLTACAPLFVLGLQLTGFI